MVRESYTDSLADTSFEGMLNYNPQQSHEEDVEGQQGEDQEDDQEKDEKKEERSNDEILDNISYGEDDEESNDENMWDDVNESGEDEDNDSNSKGNDTTTNSVDVQKSTQNSLKPFIFYEDSVDTVKGSDDEIEPNGILPGELQQFQLADSDFEFEDESYEEDNPYDDEEGDNDEEEETEEDEEEEEEEERDGDNENGEGENCVEEEVEEEGEDENNEECDVNNDLKTKIDKLNRLKLVLSPRVRDFVIEHGTASISGSRDLDEEEARASSQSQELLDIMNEYNQLIAYLDSPKGPTKPAPTQGHHKKVGLKEDGVSLVKRNPSVAAIAASVIGDHAQAAKAPHPNPSSSKPAMAKSKSSKLHNGKGKDKNKKKKGKKQKKVVVYRPKPDPPAPVVKEELKDVSVIKNDLEIKRLAKKKLAEIEEKNKVWRI